MDRFLVDVAVETSVTAATTKAVKIVWDPDHTETVDAPINGANEANTTTRGFSNIPDEINVFRVDNDDNETLVRTLQPSRYMPDVEGNVFMLDTIRFGIEVSEDSGTVQAAVSPIQCHVARFHGPEAMDFDVVDSLDAAHTVGVRTDDSGDLSLVFASQEGNGERDVAFSPRDAAGGAETQTLEFETLFPGVNLVARETNVTIPHDVASVDWDAHWDSDGVEVAITFLGDTTTGRDIELNNRNHTNDFGAGATLVIPFGETVASATIETIGVSASAGSKVFLWDGDTPLGSLNVRDLFPGDASFRTLTATVQLNIDGGNLAANDKDSIVGTPTMRTLKVASSLTDGAVLVAGNAGMINATRVPLAGSQPSVLIPDTFGDDKTVYVTRASDGEELGSWKVSKLFPPADIGGSHVTVTVLPTEAVHNARVVTLALTGPKGAEFSVTSMKNDNIPPVDVTLSNTDVAATVGSAEVTVAPAGLTDLFFWAPDDAADPSYGSVALGDLVAPAGPFSPDQSDITVLAAPGSIPTSISLQKAENWVVDRNFLTAWLRSSDGPCAVQVSDSDAMITKVLLNLEEDSAQEVIIAENALDHGEGPAPRVYIEFNEQDDRVSFTLEELFPGEALHWNSRSVNLTAFKKSGGEWDMRHNAEEFALAVSTPDSGWEAVGVIPQRSEGSTILPPAGGVVTEQPTVADPLRIGGFGDGSLRFVESLGLEGEFFVDMAMRDIFPGRGDFRARSATLTPAAMEGQPLLRSSMEPFTLHLRSPVAATVMVGTTDVRADATAVDVPAGPETVKIDWGRSPNGRVYLWAQITGKNVSASPHALEMTDLFAGTSRSVLLMLNVVAQGTGTAITDVTSRGTGLLLNILGTTNGTLRLANNPCGKRSISQAILASTAVPTHLTPEWGHRVYFFAGAETSAFADVAVAELFSGPGAMESGVAAITVKLPVSAQGTTPATAGYVDVGEERLGKGIVHSTQITATNLPTNASNAMVRSRTMIVNGSAAAADTPTTQTSLLAVAEGDGRRASVDTSVSRAWDATKAAASHTHTLVMRITPTTGAPQTFLSAVSHSLANMSSDGRAELKFDASTHKWSVENGAGQLGARMRLKLADVPAHMGIMVALGDQPVAIRPSASAMSTLSISVYSLVPAGQAEALRVFSTANTDIPLFEKSIKVANLNPKAMALTWNSARGKFDGPAASDCEPTDTSTDEVEDVDAGSTNTPTDEVEDVDAGSSDTPPASGGGSTDGGDVPQEDAGMSIGVILGIVAGCVVVLGGLIWYLTVGSRRKAVGSSMGGGAQSRRAPGGSAEAWNTATSRLSRAGAWS